MSFRRQPTETGSQASNQQASNRPKSAGSPRALLVVAQ